MHEARSAYETIIGPVEERMLRAIGRIVRDDHDAEDAMQNALATIHRRWHRVVAHPAPQALVLKICIDAAYDVTRRRRKHRSHDAELIEPADPRGPASTELVRRETHAEVLAAIHRLSRRQAAAISLRVFEDMPYEQIAVSLGCTAATARKHVARAREHLRRLLAHHLEEIEHEPR